jgi:hypothetical protein
LDSDLCEVWSYSGCANEQAAITLAQFIREHAPDTRIVVHRDRDYAAQPETDAYVAKLNAAGVQAFITVGTDIESHFLNYDHLATIGQPLDAAQIAQLVDEATQATQEMSVTRLINSRVKAAQRKRNREGGDEPNYGQIAAAAQADYAANVPRYRFGKTVLGRVIGLLQQAVGHNVQVAQDSAYLRVDSLAVLAADLTEN